MLQDKIEANKNKVYISAILTNCYYLFVALLRAIGNAGAEMSFLTEKKTEHKG